MSGESKSKYIEAGLAVLQELGGGPISTKTLMVAATERGYVGEGKWVYHALSRAVRDSGLFDTSKRGYISLAKSDETTVQGDEGTVFQGDEDVVVVNNPPQFEEPADLGPVLTEETEEQPAPVNPFSAVVND